MLRTVVLHGDLKARFGGPFRMDVATPREAGRALASQLKGFESFVSLPRDGALPTYRVVVGPLDGENDRGEEELDLALGRHGEVHIVPVVAGAAARQGPNKAKAAIKIVIGVVLIALSVYSGGATAGAGAASISSAFAAVGVTAAQVAFIGLSMVAAGVQLLLSAQPKANYGQREDQKSSFLFNGAVNLSEQGNCIPVIFGEVITGSLVASASMAAVRIT